MQYMHKRDIKVGDVVALNTGASKLTRYMLCCRAEVIDRDVPNVKSRPAVRLRALAPLPADDPGQKYEHPSWNFKPGAEETFAVTSIWGRWEHWVAHHVRQDVAEAIATSATEEIRALEHLYDGCGHVAFKYNSASGREVVSMDPSTFLAILQKLSGERTASDLTADTGLLLDV